MGGDVVGDAEELLGVGLEGAAEDVPKRLHLPSQASHLMSPLRHREAGVERHPRQASLGSLLELPQDPLQQRVLD